MIGQTIGSYRVLAKLGEGGMGVVYRARDSRLNRDVALKVLLPEVAGDSERLARLTREAQLLAALNHPNIAQIHGLEESHPGGIAIVMELVDGPTLQDRIASGPIPVAEAIRIATEVARALEAAHEQHIVHRDVKPSNVKIRPDGTVKVLDFGVAKALPDYTAPAGDASTMSVVRTESGAIIGTPAYMAPEQAKGQRVDKRADIWAFGCLLHEMLTGHRAFAEGDTASTLAAILTKDPDWSHLPADTPPALATFLRRSLEKDQTKRLRDIGDMRLALEGAFDSDQRPTTASRDSRWSAWAAAAGWIIAALTSVLAWALWANRVVPDDRPLSFHLDPPSDSEFSLATMQPYPALSPDGRQLAFLASARGRVILWVQTIGESDARPLRGTEGAENPFWSPDGTYIGFEQKGSLVKIATASDGAPEVVCTCSTQFGASWGPGGTILFAEDSGLAQVPAGGGTPTHVTQVDSARGEFSHRYPVLLPDGRRFLYLIRSSREEHRGLFLGALDDPTLKQRLVSEDSNGAIVRGRDGRDYLFFVRDLTLLAQAIDLERGQLTGSATVVARPVVPGETGRYAPFAVSERTLVYRQTIEPLSEVLMVNRRGATDGVIAAADGYRYPTLSRDTTKLAIARMDANTGKRDIWVFDLGRRVGEQITRDPVGAMFPAWRPDGLSIVFSSAREGPWNLYSHSADGTGTDRSVFVAPTPGTKYVTELLGDGNSLVFTGDGAVWHLPLEGNAQPVKLAEGSYGRVSPDRRWLAYSARAGAELQTYVTRFPDPIDRWRISNAGGTDPQWRRDGQELYYIDQNQMLTAVPVTTSHAFSAGTPVPLFRITSTAPVAPGWRYAPAPDGQRFFVLDEVRPGEIRLNVRINWAASAAGTRPIP